MVTEFTVTITEVEEFSVEYQGCGSHQMQIKILTRHPYDFAAALRRAASELEQDFEASGF